MNFRSIFLSSIVLIALSAAFGFTPKKRVLYSSDWIYSELATPKCMRNTGHYANESVCSPWNTGPVCTVTPGVLPTRTAYYTNGPAGACTLPWRQP